MDVGSHRPGTLAPRTGAIVRRPSGPREGFDGPTRPECPGRCAVRNRTRRHAHLRPPASAAARGCARSRAIAHTPSAGPTASGMKA
ncbi:MAG: hypothetical protein BroJett026_18440 [Betaproteobacteria bacterium]|nr:MAG: hypothetical protein BroJett026_18440 [Betaproteobacteria bacterium]